MEKEKNQSQTKSKKVRAIRAEVYSRVVGYYRPVQAWNEGKREEFRERRYLKTEKR
jgi:anaerobic ribonucleoside-triphosphate reductase